MAHIIRYVLSIIILVTVSFQVFAGDSALIQPLNFTNAWETVKDDYLGFYSRDRMLRLGMVFGAGAILANTHIDESFQKWYRTDIHSSSTDDFARATKNFGEWKYLVPVTFGAAIFDEFVSDKEYQSPISQWGVRTARAYILGTPILLVTKEITGASRPKDGVGSTWRPFNDVNGVSGHAFVGAVPFLTFAKMNEDNDLLKYLAYAASTLTAISRINDDAHYLSQAALGWYLAWEATGTIDDQDNRKKFRVAPMSLKDGYGIYVGMEW